MKTRSVALAAHQALGTTTIARCWRFVRRDGQIIRVTTCARDLTIDGELYLSKDGANPASIEAQAGASVTNSEATGTLADTFVTEADILKGLWDGAAVTIFEVNYRDLTQGKMLLPAATIGEVKVGRSAFNAEVRGLAQALQQVIGEVYTAGCTAIFGDALCKKAVGPLTVTGTVTSVATRASFTDSGRSEAADYFGAGIVTWLTGANAGAKMEVASFASGVFTLCLPMPANIVAGDTYSAVPGCRKRFTEDCKTKWSNVVNFRGFPYVPGSDRVLGLGGTPGTAT